MRVLLTGVSGFFGSHMLEHLLEKTDWHIVGIASWKHKGIPERVEEVLSGKDRSRVTIITHDLSAPLTEKTKKRIGEIDYIINVASDSHVDRSITDPVPFVENNVSLVLNVLEFAREIKPKKFIQFSTDEVYGPATHGENHKEWSTILPSNPYSASKAAQEAIAFSYWRTYGLPLIITNTLNLFGEMQDAEKYIAKAIRCVENGDVLTVHGTSTDIGSRFYIHARNAADAVLHILKNVDPVFYSDKGTIDRPERFNVVGFDELNNLEIAQLVAEIMGKTLNYEFTDYHSVRPGHDRRYALDGTKLKEIGWTSPIPLREALERYIKWTLAHPNWI